MLYIDTSALAKVYWRESGSDAVVERFKAGGRVFTSALSYAEILTAMGRKRRANELSGPEFASAREAFLHDWTFLLNVIEVDTRTMRGLDELVTRYTLKASDGVHLSAALWLRDIWALGHSLTAGETRFEFGVADKPLARIATEVGLLVFNPEDA